MKKLEYQSLLDTALAVVADAAAVARRAAPHLKSQTKAHRNDLVTEVDREIERFVADRLRDLTGYPLLGEEGHGATSPAGRVWVLDPIDGTLNFVLTRRDFAISLALCEDGVPVMGVVSDVMGGKTYTAIKGQGAHCNGSPLAPVSPETAFQDGVILTDFKEIVALPRLADAIRESRGHRRYGSAALECIEVAASRAAAFVHLYVSPWDIAAASLICQEVGLKVTRLDGTSLRVWEPGSILVAAPRAQRDLVERLFQVP